MLIDKRKNQTEYPIRIKEFIKEAEKQGFEVEYKKQYISKSILVLRKGGREEGCEIQHAITNGRIYFRKIWKPMIWDMMQKIEEAKKGETK